MNYRRVPMESRLALERSGQHRPWSPFRRRAAMNALHERTGSMERAEWKCCPGVLGSRDSGTLTALPRGGPDRLKQTLLGLLRWTGVDGMVNPFDSRSWRTGSASVRASLRRGARGAHLAGFAHEAEANFVGFLTCRREVPAQCSGWLYLCWRIAERPTGVAHPVVGRWTHSPLG
jgi:hypothetical protein